MAWVLASTQPQDLKPRILHNKLSKRYRNLPADIVTPQPRSADRRVSVYSSSFKPRLHTATRPCYTMQAALLAPS